MEQTTIYSGYELPSLGGTGDTFVHGRFASRLGRIGAAAVRIGKMAGPRVADVPGRSVPNGRRLRS